MSVGHGPGHQVDHDQRRPKAQPGGHQRHRQCRHDHQLLPELQVVPGLSQVVEQAGEERRVGVTGQQGGADVLGDQGPVPQAQQPHGQADRQGGGREGAAGGGFGPGGGGGHGVSAGGHDLGGGESALDHALGAGHAPVSVTAGDDHQVTVGVGHQGHGRLERRAYEGRPTHGRQGRCPGRLDSGGPHRPGAQAPAGVGELAQDEQDHRVDDQRAAPPRDLPQPPDPAGDPVTTVGEPGHRGQGGHRGVVGRVVDHHLHQHRARQHPGHHPPQRVASAPRHDPQAEGHRHRHGRHVVTHP